MQAAHCATSKIASPDVVVKPLTSFTISCMFYFQKCPKNNIFFKHAP